jgi:hypothetical protein
MIVLISLIARLLERVDAYTFVVRRLEPFLTQPIVDVDEETLLTSLRKPMSRQIFDYAVQAGLDVSLLVY